MYTNKFYTQRRDGAIKSASVILDLLWDIVEPESVLDVGCATGIWLAEAKKKKAKKILGVDGSWVPKENLEISEKFFIEHDLSKPLLRDLGRYDIAFCIEVAEHLQKDAGDELINLLTRSSDMILFSAAVPGQGGTGHVNEQPQSYWAKKFKEKEFSCVDIVRPNIWDNQDVNVIYKQNMLVYVHTKSVFYTDVIKPYNFICRKTNYDIDRIHPDLFNLRIRNDSCSFIKLMKKVFNKILKSSNC